MPEREKVMAGLVTCIAACNGKTVCLDCWYMHDYSGGCEAQLLTDALVLLKQQAQDLTDIHADLQESIADNLRLQELVNAQEPITPHLVDWGIYECPKCKTRVDKTYKFCKVCGKGMKWE